MAACQSPSVAGASIWDLGEDEIDHAVQQLVLVRHVVVQRHGAGAEPALMAIPILMVVLSASLPARANRAVNLVVASLYVVVSIGNAVGESWVVYDALAVGLEVVVLAGILRWAWAWPRSVVATRGAVVATAATH